MARTKTPTAPPEPETIVEAPAAKPVAKASTAEPTVVTITAQHLAECLAGYAFALAAFGAGKLSREGRAAFRDIVAYLDAADGKPPARYEIPADGAFWINHDLVRNRHQRPALTAGEVALGHAVTHQTPELARRLSAKASTRPPLEGGLSVTRPPIESVVLVTDPKSSKFPSGNHFDRFGRPVGPKLAAPSTF